MLTIQEGKKIALATINHGIDPKNERAILHEYTLAKPYAWAFTFNTRTFVETGDILFALGGNRPVVVEHNKGVHEFGTAQSSEETIAEFEAKRRWWRW